MPRVYYGWVFVDFRSGFDCVEFGIGDQVEIDGV